MTDAIDAELIARVLAYRRDPVGFVRFAFPWGEPHTPLANVQAPRAWQAAALEELAGHCLANYERVLKGRHPITLRDSTRSGRGVGKSALVGMVSVWFMSCHLGASALITANSESQLKSRTLPEIRKWFSLAINSHWWDVSALMVRPARWYAQLVEQQLKIDPAYYYLQAQLWSEENPDAFAGLHNPNGVLLIYDEASGIPDPIWNVSEGFFTEPVEPRFWYTFSNPRRTTGLFHATHTQPEGYGARWRTRHVSSTEVEGVDGDYLNSLIAAYGEDSNVVRVEVFGEFPVAEDDKVIPLHLVQSAREREVEPTASAPWYWGLDPARMGDDNTALAMRQGNYVAPITTWRKLDTMQIVGRVLSLYEATPEPDKPALILVDSIGVGAGVVDRLRELDVPARGVNVAETPALGRTYLNLRAELWFKMLEWLRNLDCRLPGDDALTAELISVGYGFTPSGKIKLESKRDIKAVAHSPDRADALALTFAAPASRAMGHPGPRGGKLRRNIHRIV